MKKLLLSLLLAAMPAVAFAQNVSLSTTLTGAAEVPGPGDPDGVGFAVVTISGTSLTYSVIHSQIGAPTLAHIHRAPVGVQGPPVVDFNVATLVHGTATISQALANEIAANPSLFYVNVHTSDFPNGAIRGQLAAAVEAGTRSAYLPVVGKVTGANNTNFVTDLRIVNHGAATAMVTLDYFAQSGATVTKTVTIAPGEQKVLDDLVGGTLQTTGLGALRITSDQNVTVTSRVINDLRANGLGTTGFSMTTSDAKTSGTISFLSQSSGPDQSAGTGFRTNLGYFNPNPSAVSATFVARRTSDGAILGTNTISIPARGMVQQPAFNLLSAVSEADRIQPNFYVTWTANAPIFAYGSVVDNKTGDSVFIE